MLRSGDTDILEPVWDLIQKLPVNVILLCNLRDMNEIKKAKAAGNAEQLNLAWSQLIDPKSIYKLFYCFSEIKKTFLNMVLNQKVQSQSG
jgi:hypothetical protein